jgi:dienelactone hydrolase
MTHTDIEERDFRLDDELDALRTIRGRLTYAAGAEDGAPRPYVLVLHGFKGFMDWGFFPELARRIARSGLVAVSFNFSGSGHGERPLEFSEHDAFFANTPSRELDDVQRVRAWIDSGAVPWIDRQRAGVFGHSLGGGVALVHAARRHDYRALVGWACVSTFRRFPAEIESVWRRQGWVEIPNLRTKEVHRLGTGWLDDLERNARVLDIHAACRRLATPSLLLHGSADEAVPLAEGEALARAFGPGVGRLEVLAGANHTFWAAHPLLGVSETLARALERTLDFLAERLSSPGRA